MHHHEIGFGPAQNAWIALKWTLIWLVCAGLPCVISIYFPAWPKDDTAKTSSHH